MDEDYEYEKEKVLDKRRAAGWVLCTACGVELHDDDVAEGTGCDCQMEQSKCMASFHAYDVDTILRYGLSAEVLEEVDDFRQWLRSIVKHGGPKVNGKSVYDLETAMRICEAFNEKVSGAN